MFKTLDSVPLFKGVDKSILDLLEPLFEPYSCSAEMAIFEQGDPAHYMYLILDGAVEMVYKPYDGPPITINNHIEGSIIGWSAVIGNATYTSGAVCKDETRAIRMSKRDLQRLCEKDPEVCRIILNLLAESVSSRWHDAKSQIQVLLTETVSAQQSTNLRKRRKKKENS